MGEFEKRRIRMTPGMPQLVVISGIVIWDLFVICIL